MEALLGRAQCLDKLAEIEKSNQILDRAIDSYSKITLDFVKNNIVNEEIFETAAFRCIDRMRFKGKINSKKIFYYRKCHRFQQ